ncbi:hypothetical protein ACFVUP_39525, partial [Streptomyces bacillaris]|uniref:hypothetical protein n=1 Tax=Streptomyces bacillaris TaxID=68179 RepID=UPI0036DC7976
MQQFYNAITARGDYPPVAVAAGSSLSVTFASQGTLHAFNLAPAVPVTVRWGGEQRAATLGGQLWGTYSAAAESIVMHPLKDALTTTTSDSTSGSSDFAAATTATLAEAPISA